MSLLQSLQQGAPHGLHGRPPRLNFEGCESKPEYGPVFVEHPVRMGWRGEAASPGPGPLGSGPSGAPMTGASRRERPRAGSRAGAVGGGQGGEGSGGAGLGGPAGLWPGRQGRAPKITESPERVGWAEPRGGEGAPPSLPASLRPAGPRPQALTGSHGVRSRTEGQDLTEQGEGGCFAPAQTQTDSKPPPDEAKGLTSWQPTLPVVQTSSERANPYSWPPAASGFRTQTVVSAREVPLRPARTAVGILCGRGVQAAPRRARACLPSLLPLAPLSLPSSSHRAHLSWERGVSKDTGSRRSAAGPCALNRQGQLLVLLPCGQGKAAWSYRPRSGGMWCRAGPHG